MRKLTTMISSLILTSSLASISAMAAEPTAAPVKVGILVPMQLPAMDEIVSGFEKELNQQYAGKIDYVVKNSAGDPNLQRAILQQFKDSDVNLVAPIGTDAAQMAISMIRTKPIVAIAAEFSDADLAQSSNHNATDVLDEISIEKQVQFIHQAMPDLKQMTLVYSPDDKIFKEVEQADAAAKQSGITLQKLMISQLPDLYTVSKQIDPQSQAIFILKDETVVSGIRTLVNQAMQLHIPVIASDDGSVQKGAAFAVGVSESDIGKDAAGLAAKVLSGTAAGSIPVKTMTTYKVFVNQAAMQQQGVHLDTIQKAAQTVGYPVVNLAGLGA